MLSLEMCYPRHVLALLMYTASPAYQFTLLQHPVLQTVGSCIPFWNQFYWYTYQAWICVFVISFLMCHYRRNKLVRISSISVRSTKQLYNSVVGPGSFSGIEGYMMHPIHPQFHPGCPRTNLKYLQKTPLVKISIFLSTGSPPPLISDVGSDQYTFGMSHERACMWDRKGV